MKRRKTCAGTKKKNFEARMSLNLRGRIYSILFFYFYFILFSYSTYLSIYYGGVYLCLPYDSVALSIFSHYIACVEGKNVDEDAWNL